MALNIPFRRSSGHRDFTSLQNFATHYSIVKYLSFLCFSATRSRWGTSKFLQVIKSVKRANHIHFSKPVRHLGDIFDSIELQTVDQTWIAKINLCSKGHRKWRSNFSFIGCLKILGFAPLQEFMVVLTRYQSRWQTSSRSSAILK